MFRERVSLQLFRICKRLSVKSCLDLSVLINSVILVNTHNRKTCLENGFSEKVIFFCDKTKVVTEIKTKCWCVIPSKNCSRV